MPRKPKQGIDFAGWSVNMFDGDKKIDKLLDSQGWKGFGVYFFLCQSAYKMNGYYLEWCYDDCATTARRMGGFMGTDTVESTVRLCLRVGLFDQGLFDRWSVLTSKGIQRRFWSAVAGRRAVPLYTELWLLPPEEAEGLGKVARFYYLSPTNADLQPTNADLQPTNDTKVKESKVKQSKVNNSIPRARATAPEEMKDEDLLKMFAPDRKDVRAFAKERNSTADPDRFFDWYNAAKWRDKNGTFIRNWKQKFMVWELTDNGKSSDKQHSQHVSQRSAGDDFNIRYDNDTQ